MINCNRGESPADDIRLPFTIFVQVSAKDICRIRRRFLWDVDQVHVHLFSLSSTLAVIAVRAGCHHVRPNVLAAHVTRDYMVNRQTAITFAAVLAGIIITAEYFAPGQLDVRAWSMNLRLQSNNGRSREQFFYRSNVSTSINDHVGFPRK